MLKNFLKDNEATLTLTGLMTAVAGLFLNIEQPDSEKALSALRDLQALFVCTFTLCASIILWNFVKAVWKEEKVFFKKHDAPNVKSFTIITSYASLLVVTILANFATNAYPKILYPLSQMLFTVATIGFAALPLIPLNKKPKEFGRCSAIIIFSFSLSVLVTFLIVSSRIFILNHMVSYDFIADTFLISFASSNILFAIASYIQGNKGLSHKIVLQIPEKVPEPGFYHHYKHDPEKGVRDYAYEVVGIGFHTEDDARPGEEHFLIYRPLYEAAVYTASKQLGLPCFDNRPLKMWMEDVTKDGKIVPRFQKITDPAAIAELERVRDGMYK